MGGQTPEEYHSRHRETLFDESNPQYKTQDEKLQEIRVDCKKFVRVFETCVSTINERIDALIIPPDNSESIAAIHSELSILKSAFTNFIQQNDEMKNQIEDIKKEMKTFTTKDETTMNVNSFRQMLKENVVETQKLKNSFDEVKQGFVVAKPTIVVDPPKISEPVKDSLEGWMSLSELTKHVKYLIDAKKISCNHEFGSVGRIGDLMEYLKIAVPRHSSHSGRNLRPTGFGESLGIIKEVLTKTTYNTYYNVEKCIKLLEEASKDPFGIISKYTGLSAKYYEGVTE